MAAFPQTTVKVKSIEPCGDTKVCITMELTVDVHRLAEVGSEMLHAAVAKVKEDQVKSKKKK